ncbi:PD-(D/E)XK nuclease superfamily protein [bacterium A37T11]|nr:PD-(D/E)XK nuclease superfamily protein [bacterium A37T11]
MTRKYPIGLQSFRKIREEGFLYIDKTEYIHQLVAFGNYFFLSRPRRFGKSLLLATVKELFSGSRELFEGLWIYDHWDWEQNHPVIHLRISRANYQDHGLAEALSRELDEVAEELGIQLSEKTPKDKFKELIKKSSVNQKVIILVDEYDKPMVDYLDDSEKVAENREIFRNFYSILKDADDQIRFLLITGVSRFSKVGIFSSLNNLEDISMVENMNELVGITQQELEKTFIPEIDKWAEREEMSREEKLAEVKEWYNGYSWGGEHTVYNPFSLLSYMKYGHFDNFWIDTGAPSFLIQDVRKRPSSYLFKNEDITVGAQSLKDYNTEAIDTTALMFQTGFLTVKKAEWKTQTFTLGYPNKEVKQSVLDFIAAGFTFINPGHILPKVDNLRMAFIRNDIPYVIEVLDTLFISIPNPVWIGATERFFHGIIFNTFQLLGINQESEISNAVGRLDIAVKTNTHIYALEFKLDKTADEALNQILDSSYLKPYQLDPRQKVAIGINFSSKMKSVAEYLVKEL